MGTVMYLVASSVAASGRRSFEERSSRQVRNWLITFFCLQAHKDLKSFFGTCGSVTQYLSQCRFAFFSSAVLSFTSCLDFFSFLAVRLHSFVLRCSSCRSSVVRDTSRAARRTSWSDRLFMTDCHWTPVSL